MASLPRPSRRPTALITGAQRGIGRAIALALADAGFDVALADIALTDDLHSSVHAATRSGARAVALAVNLGDLATLEPMLDAAQAALGPIDCLVNNAGVSVLSRGDLLEVTPEAYDHCQDINTRGTFFLTQAFARRLLARGAGEAQPHRSIVTITSSNAQAVSVERGEYCVSKAALSMVSQLFAARLGGDGIGVYEVMPGLIDTEMSAASKPHYDALLERGWLVVPRRGRPEEVARVVCTMAQGLLPYTVGQAVRVDGGLLINRY